MNAARVPVERVVEFLRNNKTLSNPEIIDRLGCSPASVTEARQILGLVAQSVDLQVAAAVDEAQGLVTSGEMDITGASRAMAEKYELTTEQRYKVRKNLSARMAKASKESGGKAGAGSLVGEMMGGELSMIWQRRAWK